MSLVPFSAVSHLCPLCHCPCVQSAAPLPSTRRNWHAALCELKVRCDSLIHACTANCLPQQGQCTHPFPHITAIGLCGYGENIHGLLSEQLSLVQCSVISRDRLLCVSSLEVTHLVTQSVDPWTDISPFLTPSAPGNQQSTLWLRHF